MATTKRTTPAKKNVPVASEKSEQKSGITLTVTITEEQYALICRAVETYGYSSVEEWLLEAITDHV